MSFRAAQDTAHALWLFAVSTRGFRAGGPEAVLAATRDSLSHRPSSLDEVTRSGVDIWRVARAVWRAKGIWPLRADCLQTAIVTRRIFRSYGLEAPVRLGANLYAGSLVAHAWVELGGLRIDDQSVTTPGELRPVSIPVMERRPE